ncbi:hypothetical protein [Roseovarius sp.]|uniref:hypothetical protein n=1 Tax=Roseovarius sp. TaxID=1486281 RepID=UPI003A97FD5F
MHRRLVLQAFCAVMLALAVPAMAQPVRLTAAEVQALLSGNTIDGNWAGTAYQQFFNADGSTVFVLADGRRDEGRWRVNPDTNDYESWWRSTGWTPYAMVRTEAGGLAWINGEQLEPFEVLPGRQME